MDLATKSKNSPQLYHELDSSEYQLFDSWYFCIVVTRADEKEVGLRLTYPFRSFRV